MRSILTPRWYFMPAMVPSTSRNSPLRFVYFAICLLVTVTSEADYQPIDLHELFRGSDLIVLGTISDVSERSFVIEDIEVVFGATGDAPPEVKRYTDWTGNRRWNGYQSGQTVLLFLLAPATNMEDKNDYWQIRGAGGEGEMPVDKGFVYPHGLNLKGFSRQKFKVQQGTLYGYRFKASTFLSAIKGYLECFSLDKARGGDRPLPTSQICDDDVLENYRNESTLHHYLVNVSIKGVLQD